MPKRAGSGDTSTETSTGTSTECSGIDTQTDNRNCGACGRVCSAIAPSTAKCTLGRCLVTLVADDALFQDLALAIGASDVYWTSGSIMKVPLGGGRPTVAATADNASAVAVDAKNLYWTDYWTSQLMKMPISGGPTTTLASGQHSLRGGLVVDASNVTWTTWRDAGFSEGGVLTIPINGGTPKVLASGLNNPTHFTLSAGRVYWSDSERAKNQSTIQTVPIAGGSVTTLVSGPMDSYDLVVDTAYVYYSSHEDIRRVPVGGGPSSILVSQTGGSPFAVDATSIYWADNPSMWDSPPREGESPTFTLKIMKTPIKGGEATTMVSIQSSQPALWVTHMAVDGTSLYWVMRGAPPSLVKLTPK